MMDEGRPKRRKDKYNPYAISQKDNSYFLHFTDGEGISHNQEIDKTFFDLFDSFELEDLSYLNKLDRHIEQLELTEALLDKRTVNKSESLEETVIKTIQIELLRDLILKLPEKQRRRVYLYYFKEWTYEQIAKWEGCTHTTVIKSINKAIKNLKKIFLI